MKIAFLWTGQQILLALFSLCAKKKFLGKYRNSLGAQNVGGGGRDGLKIYLGGLYTPLHEKGIKKTQISQWRLLT